MIPVVIICLKANNFSKAWDIQNTTLAPKQSQVYLQIYSISATFSLQLWLLYSSFKTVHLMFPLFLRWTIFFLKISTTILLYTWY